MNKLLKSALVLFGAYSLFKAVAGNLVNQFYEGLRISFLRAEPRLELSTLTFRLEIFFEIENSNEISVDINSFDGAVYYGSTALGAAFLPSRFTLAAGLVNTLQVSFATPVAQLPSVMSSIVTQGWQGLILRLEGDLKTGLVNIPISENITLV